MQFTKVAVAFCALTLAGAPVLADEAGDRAAVRSAEEGERFSPIGKVKSVDRERSPLDYAKGEIVVEMDDYDFYPQNNRV